MIVNALSQIKAKKAKAGKYADGQGLWLVKRNQRKGKWVLRFVLAGRRREMGLGRWPDVGIAEARQKASEARGLQRSGIDPIAEKQRNLLTKNILTLGEAIIGCLDARKAELKKEGSAGKWLSPLRVHIIPKIGKLPVESIDQHILKKVLEPIWHEKPEAAMKACRRVGLALKYAAALGLDVDLQAVMKTRALLGKQNRTTQHIPSLPYEEMPAFYAWLKGKETPAYLALRFLILTVARTSEVRFLAFCEIKDDIWTLEPERTKANREHRIPLIGEAQKLLTMQRENATNGYVFSSYSGKALSDAAMTTILKKNGYTCRPHGFRASFRTWVEEQTDTPFEVKEAALGHTVDTNIVQAYQRSDRLEKRRALMELWSSFLTGN